jgi:predicted dehydrogenase
MHKNIGVIGCGHWGKNLVRNFSELGALNSVCDPNIELAEKYAKAYSVNNLSFEEILNDTTIEGVVLAVPAPLHHSITIKALDAGKHVFVEKPLAMNKEEALDMIQKSKEKNLQLMVGHLLQYHPVFIKMLELVNLGQLGDLSYIYSNRLSFGKIRSEEDIIWSFAPHDISMILALVGDNPQSIQCKTSCIVQKNIADKAHIHMRFNKDITGHINVSWLHPFKEQKIVVIGSSSMAVFDDTKPWDQKLALYKHKFSLNQNTPHLEKADVEYIEVSMSEPLRNECKHFIEVVNNKILPLTNAEEGLRVVEVLTEASSKRNLF